jgi:hypothetical protein
MTIGELKDLQDEYGLDDSSLIFARKNEKTDILLNFLEDVEIEPVDYDGGYKIIRGAADAIILNVDDLDV